MKHDKKTGINLGAGLVLSSYDHVLQYVDKRKLEGKHFFCDKECVSAPRIIFKSLRNPLRLAKLLFLAWRFGRHINRTKKRLPYESPKQVIERDPIILNSLSTPASDFVREHGIEYLNEKCINPIIASTFYVDFSKTTVFYYLGTLSTLFSRVYIPDFTHTVKRLTKGFEESILLETVTKVKRVKGVFEVKTSKGVFIAENVVFAAPEQSLREVYPLPKPHIQQSVHRFIVRGKKRREYRNKECIVFDPARHSILKLSENGNGYDIISSHEAKPKFEEYYESHTVVKHIFWEPATIVPNKIIGPELEKNVYIASDYNLCSLEYSFVSGLYAANKILGIAE